MVNSWKEILSTIEQYKVDFLEEVELWFRGQCDSEYVLLSSLFRFSRGMEKEN